MHWTLAISKGNIWIYISISKQRALRSLLTWLVGLITLFALNYLTLCIYSLPTFLVFEFFLFSFGGRKRMLKKVLTVHPPTGVHGVFLLILNTVNSLITFPFKRSILFDIPSPPPLPTQHLNLMDWIKRSFKFSSFPIAIQFPQLERSLSFVLIT